MISCQTIGSYGRLGNQMFQLAALCGVAAKKKTGFWFSPGRLQDVFTLAGINPSSQHQQPKYLYSEPKFSFCEDIFLVPDFTEIHGYFQTEKYWQHIKDDIVRAFEVKQTHVDRIPRELKDFCASSTFMHVRRGDYLQTNGFHPTLEPDFYRTCLGENNHISIFSDDPEWCKSLQQILNSDGFESVIVSGGELSDAQEFHLMTTCQSAVISNSTFSWWAAYLGPHQRNQRVFAPKLWFGEIGHKDTQDLYVDGWKVL